MVRPRENILRAGLEVQLSIASVHVAEAERARGSWQDRWFRVWTWPWKRPHVCFFREQILGQWDSGIQSGYVCF